MMITQQAILAGGCFWGMEDLFRKLSGVVDTEVGYSGGHTENPTYETLKSGLTGHAEALNITFDPTRITFTQLLEYFFQIHNPTTLDRQGNDKGTQYRSAIFYVNDEQKLAAESLINTMNTSGKWPAIITTKPTQATVFYPAENYHQDYLRKNPGGYTCHWERPEWKLHS